MLGWWRIMSGGWFYDRLVEDNVISVPISKLTDTQSTLRVLYS